MMPQSACCHQTLQCGGDTWSRSCARSHPRRWPLCLFRCMRWTWMAVATPLKGMMTILKGLNEHLSEDLFLSAELVTSRRPYAGVQGVYHFGCWTCAIKGEKYPATLDICSSCRAAAYDGAARWIIFVALLAVTPPGGPPSPPGGGGGGGEPTWLGYAVCMGLVSAAPAKHDLNISIDVAPTSKQATVADTTPSPESNSHGK